MTNERLDELARGIVSTLDELDGPALRLFEAGLRLADGPVAQFATTMGWLAFDRESGRDPKEPSRFALISVRVKLIGGGRTLLRAILDVEHPFWVAVRDALVEIEEDIAAGGRVGFGSGPTWEGDAAA